MKCKTYGCNNEAMKGAQHCAACTAENWEKTSSTKEQREYERKQAGQQKHGKETR